MEKEYGVTRLLDPEGKKKFRDICLEYKLNGISYELFLKTQLHIKYENTFKSFNMKYLHCQSVQQRIMFRANMSVKNIESLLSLSLMSISSPNFTFMIAC